jgi:hypothetical protein
MQIHVISFRDELRPDLLELVAFVDPKEASQVVRDLTRKYQELANSGQEDETVNRQWAAFLSQKRIPENKHFLLSFRRYGNFAMRINELSLLE